MKKMFFALAMTTAVTVIALAAGEGASQKWVNMRIAEQETNTQTVVDDKLYTLHTNISSEVYAIFELLNGGTNNVYIASAGTNGEVISTYYSCNMHAIGITNSTHSVYTNGALLVNITEETYTNSQLGVSITATPSNMVWNGIGSHTNANGITMFDDYFGVYGTYISTNKYNLIKGE